MFLGPHKMKMRHYFSVSDTLLNLGLFNFQRPPHPANFELFPTETWDFIDFFSVSQISPLFSLESFPKHEQVEDQIKEVQEELNTLANSLKKK